MSKNFQALLDTLNGVAAEAEELHKSVPAADAAPAGGNDEDETDDDEAIAAAAGEAGAADAQAADGEPGETFGKSFEVTGADGTKHEAIDATDLVKSIMERQDANEGVLAKALESMTSTLKSQGELIKSLNARVAELSSQGRGRKAVLTITEKPDTSTMAKSNAGAEGGLTVEQFMLKANTAFDQGKISGKELTVIDVCRRSNQPIDPALVQKVISATA